MGHSQINAHIAHVAEHQVDPEQGKNSPTQSEQWQPMEKTEMFIAQ